MKQTSRIIRTQHDLGALLTYLTESAKPPFHITVKKGAESRSSQQNRLAFQWYKDAEAQGDQTASEYRAFCKLTLGVPILRNDSDDFRNRYDSVVKSMPYEVKLALMEEPFDFPVTRLMNTQQMSEYLDQVYRHFTSKGFRLTEPAAIGVEF